MVDRIGTAKFGVPFRATAVVIAKAALYLEVTDLQPHTIGPVLSRLGQCLLLCHVFGQCLIRRLALAIPIGCVLQALEPSCLDPFQS